MLDEQNFAFCAISPRSHRYVDLLSSGLNEKDKRSGCRYCFQFKIICVVQTKVSDNRVTWSYMYVTAYLFIVLDIRRERKRGERETTFL